MSNLVKHAERELKLAGLFDKDSDYDGELGNAVLELVKAFAAQGHSGFSAAQTIKIFQKVASYDCLTPITGADDEWNDVSEDTLQNNRLSSVFKDKKTGRAYFIEAITWKTQNGSTWNGSADGITSKQNIKSFPLYQRGLLLM